MNSRESSRIRVYRKGNGCVLVDPGLVILSSGQTFQIVNTTGEDAVVAYDPAAFHAKAAVAPSHAELAKAKARLTLTSLAKISSRTSAEFETNRGPLYFEYEVMLLDTQQCAEGNSKPGGFVDP